MKKMILGSVAGGVTLFLLGGLIYEFLFADFIAGNAGSATGVWKDPPIFWGLGVSQLALAALVTYTFDRAGVASALDGLKAGAIFGLLLGVSIAMDFYSVMNVSNLTATMVEPIFWVVRTAVAGGVIGWTLGMGGSDPQEA
ncbi:MAG: hypothetical protein O2958_06620 [Gemmatimonadetes bacterium]|nr:hypothetical protein [Gemmatimonadota bacterium]MDA1103129.1 hypothetical protein [Gemmatimonadota bacterium]